MITLITTINGLTIIQTIEDDRRSRLRAATRMMRIASVGGTSTWYRDGNDPITVG